MIQPAPQAAAPPVQRRPWRKIVLIGCGIFAVVAVIAIVVIAGIAKWTYVAKHGNPPDVVMPERDTSLVTENPEIRAGSLGPGDLRVADGSWIDTYPIDPPPRSDVTVTLWSSDFAPYLYIAAPSGATFSKIEGPDMRGRVTANETGAYMVQVSSLTPGESGNYTLTIERIP